MEIDVFISYHTNSSRAVVEAVVNRLEGVGIRCWYAPRDVVGSYAGSIVQAIKACSVFILMLNQPAAESPQVLNELNIVTSRLGRKESVTIVPFHIADEDLEMPPDAEYYISRMHWIDAIRPPMDERIGELTDKVLFLLGRQPSASPAAGKPAAPAKAREEYRLRSNPPQARTIFDGRDDLLEEIAACFREGERVLFLEGVGGIGKSELAKQYALRNKDDYDDVLFVTYGGSLKNLVCDPGAIVIDGVSQRPEETEDEFFTRKWRVFQSLAGERTLLIVDNFDVEDDPDLEFFLSGRYRAIFTTRLRHDTGCSVRVPAIGDPKALLRIFEKNYGAPVEPEDRPCLQELFQLIEYHTYTIELLAKQMDASMLTGEELLELFKKGQLQSQSETVAGRAGRKTAFGHICAVFSTSGLSEEEKDVLRKLSLMGIGGVPAKWFREWAELDSFEVVNSLEQKSWVRRDRSREKRLSLHPMVIEVVHAVLEPDADNCAGLLAQIAKFCYSAWLRPVSENLSVVESLLAVMRYFAPFDSGDVEAFDGMANYLWQVARFDESIHYAETLYHACVRRFGEASMETGCVAKTVGGCCFNGRRTKESIPWYKEGLRCMLAAGGEESEDLAMSYEKVGRCYTWEYEQDFALAEENLKKSLEIRLRLEEAVRRGEEKFAHQPWHALTLTTARNQLGEIYMELGRMYQAAGDYARALECTDSYEQYSDFTENRSGYAYRLYDAGVCRYHLGLEARERGDGAEAAGQWKAAAENLEQALEINSQMRGDIAADTIDNRECLADVYAAMGRIAEAAGEYEAAVNALDGLFGPEHQQIRTIQEKLRALEGQAR